MQLKGSCQHCVAPKSEKSAGSAYEFNSTECYYILITNFDALIIIYL